MHTLIKDSLDKDNIQLLHGTNLDAAINLLTTGRLQADKLNLMEPSKHVPPGHLYFYPNAELMQDWEDYDLIKDFGWEDAVLNAKSSAYIVEERVQLRKKFGYMPELFKENDASSILASHRKLIQLEKETGQRGLEDFLKELEIRRGVLLCFNSKIRDFKILPGTDNVNMEVRIYLPDGISIEYIESIKPLGGFERGVLHYKFGYLKNN